MLEEFTNAELLRLGPISMLQLTSAPLGTFQWLAKRFMDIAISSVALILLSPMLMVVAGLYFLVWSAVGPAVNGIFLAALYQYATSGTAPAGFDQRTLAGAFAPKEA